MNLTDRLKQTGSKFLKTSKNKIIPYVFAGIMAFTPLINGCGGEGGGDGGNGNGTQQEETVPPEEEILPPKEVVISENAVTLDDYTIQRLTSYDENGTLTFLDTTSQLESLSPGDIIIGDVNDNSPKGFLRRIIQVYNNRSFDRSTITTGTIIETEPCTLEELVEKGSIKSTELNEATFEVMHEIDEVLYDSDGDLTTKDDQITATGNILFDLNLNFEAKFNWGLEELLFTKTINGKLDLKLKSFSAVNNIDKKITIYKESLGLYTVIIAGIPVFITPELKVNVGLKGDVPAGIVTHVTQDATSTAGLSYRDGDWEVINDSSNYFDFEIDTPPANTTPHPPKVYAGLELDLFLYDVGGPYGKINGYSKLKINVNENPWWELYGGLEAILGVKMDIIGPIIAEYPATQIDIFNKVLASADAGICTDNDSDGYYAESECGTEIDCNDNGNSVYPGAPEVCGNEIDEDCDGSDEECQTCTDTNPINESPWGGGATHFQNPAYLGQSFVANKNVISQIEVDITPTGYSSRNGEDITLEIIDKENSNILVTISQYVNRNFEGWLSFYPPSGSLQISSGSTYIIRLQDSGLLMFFWKYTTDNYPCGSLLRYGDGDDLDDPTISYPQYDARFKIE